MFDSRGLQPPLTVIETNGDNMLRELLLQGDMITAISPQQLDHELSTGALSMLPIALPETSLRSASPIAPTAIRRPP